MILWLRFCLINAQDKLRLANSSKNKSDRTTNLFTMSAGANFHASVSALLQMAKNHSSKNDKSFKKRIVEIFSFCRCNPLPYTNQIFSCRHLQNRWPDLLSGRSIRGRNEMRFFLRKLRQRNMKDRAMVCFGRSSNYVCDPQEL